MQMSSCPKCSGYLWTGIDHDRETPKQVIACFNCGLEAANYQELVTKAEYYKTRNTRTINSILPTPPRG